MFQHKTCLSQRCKFRVRVFTLWVLLCINNSVSLTLYHLFCRTYFVSLTLFIKKLKMVFQLKRKTVPMAVKDIPIHLNSRRYFIMQPFAKLPYEGNKRPTVNDSINAIRSLCQYSVLLTPRRSPLKPTSVWDFRTLICDTVQSGRLLPNSECCTLSLIYLHKFGNHVPE